jgi:hypothetical protein
MQTLTFDCEIDNTQDLVLRLPKSVTPGRHRITLLIDPPESEPGEVLAPVADSLAPRTPLWEQLSRLRAQAEQEGELPTPLAWDEMLAEVERRRGERDD